MGMLLKLHILLEMYYGMQYALCIVESHHFIISVQKMTRKSDNTEYTHGGTLNFGFISDEINHFVLPQNSAHLFSQMKWAGLSQVSSFQK